MKLGPAGVKIYLHRKCIIRVKLVDTKCQKNRGSKNKKEQWTYFFWLISGFYNVTNAKQVHPISESLGTDLFSICYVARYNSTQNRLVICPLLCSVPGLHAELPVTREKQVRSSDLRLRQPFSSNVYNLKKNSPVLAHQDVASC